MIGGGGAYVSRRWGIVPVTTVRRRECRVVKARWASVRLMCGCTLAWRHARVEANCDDRSRTGRGGHVNTVCGEGSGRFGRQILMMSAACGHQSESGQSVNRGMIDLEDGSLEGGLGLSVAL